MAQHTTKKVLLTGILALSSVFVLAACDNVTAVPNNYETPIVYKDGKAYEDDENKLGAIFDQLVSNKNDKTISSLLETIAENEFGTYSELKACFNYNSTTKKYEIKKETALGHISRHKHQFVQDDDGEGEAAQNLQLKRIEYFFNDLNERINKVVFDEVSTDTYKDTKNKTEFLEEKYARAKRKENYEIAGFNEDGTIKSGFSFKKVFVDSKFQEENVREYLTDFENTYADYITKKIIPDVYKDKLVEEYIIDNNYSTLGRAYGRKINYVKIDYSADDPNTANRLVNAFVENNLANVEGDVSYDALISWIKGFEGIETVSNAPHIKVLTPTAELTAIYGAPRKLLAKCDKDPIADDSATQAPLFASLFAAGGLLSGSDYDSFTFYENTKLGEILKNYEKAIVGGKTRFASEEDLSQYSTFTNQYQQPIEQGLVEQVSKLALESYADDGWYVKNDKDGSLSSLPDSIKNRLFNIKVSNDFDKSEWKYEKNVSYFQRLKGHAYLTPEVCGDSDYDFVLRDSSNNAIYIVEILEAPSTSKLNKGSDKAYTEPFKCEEIARHIAKILGTKDTYTTNAYTSYLKLYTFTYHDTSVYDYLNENYPNLFEDE